MNCEEKSGVLLNLSCGKQSETSCQECAKKVCSLHAYEHEGKIFCDSCFWIQYLGETDKKDDAYQEIVETRRKDVIIVDANSSQSQQSNQSIPQRDEFEFGGGSTGGGGAGGTWDYNDLDSFDIKERLGPESKDDSFFYS